MHLHAHHAPPRPTLVLLQHQVITPSPSLYSPIFPLCSRALSLSLSLSLSLYLSLSSPSIPLLPRCARLNNVRGCPLPPHTHTHHTHTGNRLRPSRPVRPRTWPDPIFPSSHPCLSPLPVHARARTLVPPSLCASPCPPVRRSPSAVRSHNEASQTRPACAACWRHCHAESCMLAAIL